jgi:putative ABC transport system permease protein
VFFNNFLFALRSLSSNKARSALTMLGVLIGVFAVAVLTSISQGVRQEVSTEVQDLGSNVVLVIPGKVDPQSGFGSSLGVSRLIEADMTALKADIPQIDAIDGIIYTGAQVENGQIQDNQSVVVGVGPDIDSLLGRKQAAGHWITQEDLDSKANVVVLDWLAAQALFPNSDPASIIGQKVEIAQQDFEIIGVDAETREISSLFSSFNPLSNRVSIPRTTAEAMVNNYNLDRFLVRIKSTDEVNSTVEIMRQKLIALHNGVEDFSIMTQDQILSTFNNIFGILTNAITGIAAISLLVGGLGIMNIMLVAVAERTKEIGIRKALGATDAQILQQFLFESVTLGLLGGLLGLGLSIAATYAIKYYLDIPGSITPEVIVLALGISIGSGIIFGVIPALRAARKKPVEALRYE